MDPDSTASAAADIFGDERGPNTDIDNAPLDSVPVNEAPIIIGRGTLANDDGTLNGPGLIQGTTSISWREAVPVHQGS